MIIGITGGIGSGKSVVSRVLRCNGFPVYDCDSSAKWLMTHDEGLKSSLMTKFGERIYYPDGSLNRKLLASMIFSDKEAREFVNNVVHLTVRNDILKRASEIQGKFFIESAILATGGLSEYCERVWIVTAPIDQRIKRVELRDGMTSEEINKRIESQNEEMQAIKELHPVELENDGKTALLPKILKLAGVINNNTAKIYEANQEFIIQTEALTVNCSLQ